MTTEIKTKDQIDTVENGDVYLIDEIIFNVRIDKLFSDIHGGLFYIFTTLCSKTEEYNNNDDPRKNYYDYITHLRNKNGDAILSKCELIEIITNGTYQIR